MEIVLYILGAIGFTQIMVDSQIMQPVRNWFQNPYWPPVLTFLKLMVVHPIVWARTYIIGTINEIIGCHQCCGFWTGLATGWLVFSALTWGQILAAGFAGSFLSTFTATFLNYLEARTIVSLQEEHKDG